MAKLTPSFHLHEVEEPMATKPIYVSSDESKHSTPNATPDYHHESIYPDINNAINHLIALQLERRSNMGIATVFY